MCNFGTLWDPPLPEGLSHPVLPAIVSSSSIHDFAHSRTLLTRAVHFPSCAHFVFEVAQPHLRMNCLTLYLFPFTKCFLKMWWHLHIPSLPQRILLSPFHEPLAAGSFSLQYLCLQFAFRVVWTSVLSIPSCPQWPSLTCPEEL